MTDTPATADDASIRPIYNVLKRLYAHNPDFVLWREARQIAEVLATTREAEQRALDAFDEVMSQHWQPCHPGRRAMKLLNGVDAPTWERWLTAVQAYRETR